MRLRRHDARRRRRGLLLRHHPLRARRRAAARGRRGLRRAARRAAAAVAPRPPWARRARRSTPPPARVITDAGYGERFIHRTGHGIGVEAHEDPYIVAGNATPLAPGHAFSIEPGIYVPGRFGLRLEDIVVAADAGPDALNRADHGLAVVEPDRSLKIFGA